MPFARLVGLRHALLISSRAATSNGRHGLSAWRSSTALYSSLPASAVWSEAEVGDKMNTLVQVEPIFPREFGGAFLRLRAPEGESLFMPALGFGTWSPDEGPSQIGDAVRTALDVGYRHLDLAEKYGNEAEVGEAVAASGVPRSDLFLTSKVWNTNHAPEHVRQACEQTLRRLRTDHLDCYLMHWPLAFRYTGPDFENGGGFPMVGAAAGRGKGGHVGGSSDNIDDDGEINLARVEMARGVTLQDTWQAMERLVDDGLVRSIGVSNFGVAQLCDLLSYARHRPVVNQVEAHPFLQQRALVEFCHREGVHVVAYAPLGRPGQHGDGIPLLEDPTIGEIAARHGAVPAQVALRWALQSGIGAVPKSANRARMAQNLEALRGLGCSSSGGGGDAARGEAEEKEGVVVGTAAGLQLDAAEMAALRALDSHTRYVNIRLGGEGCGPPFRKWGPTLLE